MSRRECENARMWWHSTVETNEAWSCEWQREFVEQIVGRDFCQTCIWFLCHKYAGLHSILVNICYGAKRQFSNRHNSELRLDKMLERRLRFNRQIILQTYNQELFVVWCWEKVDFSCPTSVFYFTFVPIYSGFCNKIVHFQFIRHSY